jgi:lipoate-protein ligase A
MPTAVTVNELRFGAEEGVAIERALSLGRAAWAEVGPGAPVWVYAASLAGDARAIGAYQHDEDALAQAVRESIPLHRRATGGPAAVMGEGVLYAALALADASALMECPRDRVLNRNVRPFLAAMRKLGGAAHYFGREALSLDRRPAGLLGWTRASDGAVLIELVLGVERAAFVPDDELGLPIADRLLGKAPIVVRDAMPAFTPRAFAEALVEACGAMAGLEPLEATLTPKQAGPTPWPALRWSSPRSIPIGHLRAGLALDARGVVEHAALVGDFYQDAQAPDLLQAALVGGLPTPERLRDALNVTYGPHGAVIEGLRSLQPALEAFLELA